jgi:hypothetical protein
MTWPKSLPKGFSISRKRYAVLYGPDPMPGLKIPRSAVIAHLQQVLLNVTLRLRQAYVAKSLQEEQLALIIADVAGPLRSCAAILLKLKDGVVTTPTGRAE